MINTSATPGIGTRRNKRADTPRKPSAKSFTEEPGEAAFYGPKIDFIVKDVVGRDWQLGTVQVDYNLPERFDLNYIGPDNQPHRPVMIHRAVRFVRAVHRVSDRALCRCVPNLARAGAGAGAAYFREVARVRPGRGGRAEESRARVTVDESDERIQAKIRNASEMKIPYLFVVGPRCGKPQRQRACAGHPARSGRGPA